MTLDPLARAVRWVSRPRRAGAPTRLAGSREVALAALPFVWLGLVVAISFVEAPLKFRAPGVTLPIGLGIGRLVFPTLNALEALLATATTALLLTDRAATPAQRRLLTALVALLIVQVGLLRPVLDDRAARIIAGQPVPPAPWHLAYIALEVVKVALLPALGVASARRGRAG